MVGRVIAPPALPGFISPVAADGSEHVAAEDEGPEAGHRPLRKVIVLVGLAAFPAVHRLEAAGREVPLEELGAALAQRILEALFGPGGKAVEGYAEAGDADPRHALVSSRQFRFRHVTPRWSAYRIGWPLGTTTGITYTSNMVLLALIGACVFGEAITLRRAAGLLLAMAGVWLLVVPPRGH